MSKQFSEFTPELRKKYHDNLLYKHPGYIFVHVELEQSINKSFKPKM